MGAAAAMIATAARDILLRRRPTEFEGLGDILPYRLLHLLHLLLGIQKTARYRVVDEDIALLLEITDLFLIQRQAHLLLLLEHLPFFHEALILGLRGLVAHKLIDLPANRLKFRLRHERVTKLAGLLRQGGLFSRCCHIF